MCILLERLSGRARHRKCTNTLIHLGSNCNKNGTLGLSCRLTHSLFPKVNTSLQPEAWRDFALGCSTLHVRLLIRFRFVKFCPFLRPLALLVILGRTHCCAKICSHTWNGHTNETNYDNIKRHWSFPEDRLNARNSSE